MKLKLKISLVLTLLVLLSFVSVPIASADGGIVVKNPDMYWGLQNMSQQWCAINYENGVENMLLTIDVGDLHGEKAAWIFPVPAKPDEAAIDIIKGFPRLLGYGVEGEAREKLVEIFAVMMASQVYTLPFWLVYYESGGFLGGGYPEEVAVHEHIEKMGLTTELVTAEDTDAFHSYLVDKELDLPADLNATLGEYIGEEYSFVVSWISDVEKFRQEQPIPYIKSLINEGRISEAKSYVNNLSYEEGSAVYWFMVDTGIKRLLNQKEVDLEEIKRGISHWEERSAYYYYEYAGGTILGVFIAFPTDEIYFPLKPTGVYGNQTIPMLICVTGHVTPELYPEIEGDTQVKYFVEGYYKVPGSLSSFFNGKTEIRGLRYTKIKISTNSSHLTEDLWIEDSAPGGVVLAGLIDSYAWVRWSIFVIFFVLSSCLASMFAGTITFRKDQPSRKKFALFGLWNVLTLIGVIAASYGNRIDTKFTQAKEVVPQKASPGEVIRRILLFGLIGSGLMLMSSIYFWWGYRPSLEEFLRLLPFAAIAYVVVCLFIAPLVCGCYDNRKIMGFVIRFSLLFLGITFAFHGILLAIL